MLDWHIILVVLRVFSREVWKRAHYELPSAISNHKRLQWFIKLWKPILHHTYERRQHCTDVNMTITNKHHFFVAFGQSPCPQKYFFGPLMALLTGQLLEMAGHELRERGKWHAANSHRSDLSLRLLQPGHGSHTLPTELLGCPSCNYLNNRTLSSPAVAAVTVSSVLLWLCNPAVLGWKGHQNHVEVIFIKTCFHLPGLLRSCSIIVGKEGEDFSSLAGGSLRGNNRSPSALCLSFDCASILPPSNSPCRSETINVSVTQSNIYCVKHHFIPFMPSASPS